MGHGKSNTQYIEGLLYMDNAHLCPSMHMPNSLSFKENGPMGSAPKFT